MIYKLKSNDNINSVAKIFGYTDPKKFFKTMRYVKGSGSWQPGQLIECPSEPTTSRDRPYDGMHHTDNGLRGKTLVEGLTMRDIADCYFRAILHSSGDEHLNAVADSGDMDKIKQIIWQEINWDAIDPVAVQQNLTCNIERMMGIFPNIPESHEGKEAL